MPRRTKAIILAGGLGTRMRSETPKVLHKLNGRPMIQHVLDVVKSAGVKDIVCVAGHRSDEVKAALKGVKTVKQKRPLGSADAVSAAKKLFKNFTGDLLVLCGDAPLVRPETIMRLKEAHARDKNACTLLTTRMKDPTSYGRIARDPQDSPCGIIEETEATADEKRISEVNAGTYCFNAGKFLPLLSAVGNKNRKKEYFLTDIIRLIHKEDLKIGSVMTDDPDEALGINTRKDLAMAEKVLHKRKLIMLMSEGVTVLDPGSTHIDEGVKIDRDTVIYPNTVIEGDVTIGKKCRIGPFARIRSGCTLRDNVEIGNFVELVRTTVGVNTRVKHHTYLGDASVGRNVNVGAGTITANYDGKKKNRTTIDDGAFIGVGTMLVAPVKIGKGARTGAGCVVTKKRNVPPKAVAIGVPARILKKGKRR